MPVTRPRSRVPYTAIPRDERPARRMAIFQRSLNGRVIRRVIQNGNALAQSIDRLLDRPDPRRNRNEPVSGRIDIMPVESLSELHRVATGGVNRHTEILGDDLFL